MNCTRCVLSSNWPYFYASALVDVVREKKHSDNLNDVSFINKIMSLISDGPFWITYILQ
jgi:hypothetical protein